MVGRLWKSKREWGVKLFSVDQFETEEAIVITYIYNTSIGGDWGLADQFYLWDRTLTLSKSTGQLTLNLQLIKKSNVLVNPKQF